MFKSLGLGLTVLSNNQTQSLRSIPAVIRGAALSSDGFDLFHSSRLPSAQQSEIKQ